MALDDRTWHVAEHASFTIAALLFWYPVIAPFPSRPTWSRWIVLPYLILADVQNTVLAAWLSFSSRPIYVHYTEVPRIGGWSALADQHAAGVLMWVPGSMAFLLPVFWIGLKMLYGGACRAAKGCAARIASLPTLPVVDSCSSGCASARLAPGSRRSAGMDLLDVPARRRFFAAAFRPAADANGATRAWRCS